MREHIIINNDRTVVIPASVYKVGNRFDHGVNKVIFDCPRYADEEQTIDLSTMKIYINYIRSDKEPLSSLAMNVTVDETDPTIMHFVWDITRSVTFVDGVLDCLVCIKKTNAEGVEEHHWNSDIFSKLFVGKGMENTETIAEENIDLITQLLLEVDTAKAEVSGVSEAINAVDEKIGSLENLTTEDKSNVVDAVNEVKEASDNVAESVDGLKGDLDYLNGLLCVEKVTISEITPTLIEQNKVYAKNFPDGETLSGYTSRTQNVIEGETYLITASVPANSNYAVCLMYTEDGTYVDGVEFNSSGTINRVTDYEVIIPSGVGIIKTSSLTSTLFVLKKKVISKEEYNPKEKDDEIINSMKLISYSVDDSATSVTVSQKYGESNLYVKIGVGGGNGLVDFREFFVDDIKILNTNNFDRHSPFIIGAEENIDGDQPTVEYFTGGNHQYNNSGSGSTPTARCTDIRFIADGKTLSANESGICSKMVIKWVNYVQGYNTSKADGSGREVLKEEHTLVFNGMCFESYVNIIPLENVYIKRWYGFQYGRTNTIYPNIRYIGATNRAVLYPSQNDTDCGDSKTLIAEAFGENHKLTITIDGEYDVGDRSMIGSQKSMFTSKSGNKGYSYMMYYKHILKDDIYSAHATYTFEPIL